MSARSSRAWGNPVPEAGPVPVDVLIPTCDRPAELATTLSGLAAQRDPDFAVLISDQGDAPADAAPAVRAMMNVLRAQGRPVELRRHLPRRGLAEQRDFLLRKASAAAVLFLDDDVWLEPGLLQRMHTALRRANCGFVGAAVQGLSYLDDRRPDEWQTFERWPNDAPERERIEPRTPAFERWRLHNAANLTHLAATLDLSESGWALYKVAWVGGCVLFDRRALADVGGFSFWRDLPPAHAGEDTVAQARVMAVYGGAGLVPSGAVHLEAPTTVSDRTTEARDLISTDPAVPVGGR